MELSSPFLYVEIAAMRGENGAHALDKKKFKLRSDPFFGKSEKRDF
jgi:hypothetical protein